VARGSVSPFEIVLTAEERAELERRARSYTAPYGVVVRAKDGAAGCGWLGERGHRSPLRYQPAGGLSVAETVLRTAPEGSGGRCQERKAAGLFPPR
jgi:hypothetical protein